MKKGFAPVMIVLVIAIIGILFFSGQALFPGMFLIPGSLTPEDYQQCKMAESTFFTIRCEPAADPTEVGVNFEYGGESFTVATKDTRIQRIVMKEEKFWKPTYLSVTDIYGFEVCRYTINPYGIVDGCSGTELTTGQTYVFNRPCDDCTTYKAVIRGQNLFLFYYNAPIGIHALQLPHSAGCFVEDFTSEVRALYLGGYDIEKQPTRSLTLQQWQTNVQHYGYKEIPSITKTLYNNQPAFCDQVNRKIIGFTKHIGVSGQCYLIKDVGNVFYDGSGTPYFCCSDSACTATYGLSNEFKCVNYHCKRAEQGTSDCIVSSDCLFTPEFIETGLGKVFLREQQCVSNKCVTKDTEVACNPNRVYAGGMCCKKDILGRYVLEACTGPLKNCDLLGADACCLATQTSYTYKPAPASDYCCDPDSDGLGYVTDSKAECEGEKDGFDWTLIFGAIIGGLLLGIIVSIALLIFGTFVPFLRGVTHFMRTPRGFAMMAIGLSLVFMLFFTGIALTAAELVL